MEPIFTKTEAEIKYEVFFDNDDFFHSFVGNSALEFDNEELKKEYMDKFINEELYAFGVVKMEVCKCCCMWSEKDSLWGIHAESAEEALNQFKEHLGVC